VPNAPVTGEVVPSGPVRNPASRVLPGGGSGTEVQNPAGRVLFGGGTAATPGAAPATAP
jgi:hypothetical protein